MVVRVAECVLLKWLYGIFAEKRIVFLHGSFYFRRRYPVAFVFYGIGGPIHKVEEPVFVLFNDVAGSIPQPVVDLHKSGLGFLGFVEVSPDHSVRRDQ